MPALLTWWSLDVAELAPGAHNDAVQAIGADLLRRLDEPHRRYHTSTHLVEVIWALEELEREGVVDPREAVLGRLVGWFHDAVYDPDASGGENEAASADLAVRDLTTLGFEPDDVERVRDLVLATTTHELVTDGLSAAFHDADLWILSAPEDRYAAYARQVREEYAAVADDGFRAARAAVLRPFLERDAVYATAPARERWEQAARANLTAELAELSSG